MKHRSKSLLLIAILTISLGILIASLHLPPVQRYALNHLKDYLKSTQGIDLSAAGFHYNLLTLSVKLNSLTLRSTSAGDLPPFLTADSVRASAGFLSLLRRKPIIEGARMDNVDVHIDVGPGVRDNLPHSPSSSNAPVYSAARLNQPLGFLIADLEIQGGVLHYVNHEHAVRIELPLWKLDMRGDRSSWMQFIRLQTEQAGRADLPGGSLPLGSLRLEAELRPGILELTNLSLNAGGSRVEVAGKLHNFDQLEMEFTSTADLNLAKLGEFAGLGKRAGGKVEAKTSISGLFANLFVSSRISGRGLALRNFKGADLKAAATWNRGSGKLLVDSLELRSPYGSASMTANLALSGEPGQSLATAEITGVELETVTRNLGLPVRLAGLAEGKAHARWKGMDIARAEGTADLHLTAKGGRPAHDLLPVSGAISATASDRRIALKIDNAEVLGARLQGDFSIVALRELEGELRASVDDMGRSVRDLEAFLGRERDPLIGAELKGPLSISSTFQGTLSDPHILAEIDAPDSAVGRLRSVSLKASASYSLHRILIENAALVWQSQILTSSGEIDLGTLHPTLNLKAHMEHGSLGAIVTGLAMDQPIQGDLSLDAAVGGTTSNVDLSTLLSLSGLRAYGENFGTLTLQGGLHGRKLELRNLELMKPQPGEKNGRLSASGSYDLDSRAYSLRIAGTDLRLVSLEVAEGVDLMGKLDLSVNGSGFVDAPFLNAKLALSDVEVDGRMFGAVSLDARIQQKHARFEARLPGLGAVSNADVGIAFPYPAQLVVKAETDLSKLGLSLAEGERLRGSMNATLKGSGDIARWQDARASLSVTNLLLSYHGQDIHNDGPLEFTYESRRLDCPSAVLAGGGSRIAISGSFPIERKGTPGALKIAGNLELSSLLDYLPERPDFSATGTIRLNGEVLGNLMEIDPRFRLTMMDGTFAGPDLKAEMRDINLDMQYNRDAVAIRSLSAKIGQAEIEAKGQLPLGSVPRRYFQDLSAGAGPAKFSAEVKGLRLDDFSAVPEAVSGTVSFHLEGEASRVEDFGALNIKAIFNQLQLRTSNYEVRQAENTRISLADGTVKIEKLLLTGPTTRLQVWGSAGLIGDQALDLHVDGDINIGIATLFSDSVRAEGNSRLELAIAGELAAPQVSGSFEMPRGEFTLQAPPIDTSNLNVRLKIGSKTVGIERFTGRLNGGDLKITGTLDYGFSGLQNVNADASVKNAFFEYPADFKTRMSADLTFRSDGAFVIMGGNAHVLEGSYRRNLDIAGEAMSYLRSDGGLQFAREQNPLLKQFRFNVQVDTRAPLLIDNNLAKLTANADLRLVGSYYRPGLIGRARLAQGGELYFNERKYLVERGTISFDKQTKIEPDLDILATTKTSGYAISLNLTGAPDNFSASLTSEPALSQPDIIAVLLTGRKLEELRGSGLNVAREQVESYFSGQLGGLLSQSAKETLGLSTVRIDPSLINPEANPGARLTIGEDITKDLGIIYSMNLVDANDQILTARYDVTRRFQTEATRQSDNSYRFDFNHNLQFGGFPVSRGKSGPGAAGQQRIGTVDLSGNTVFAYDRLLGKIGLESGEKYDFFKFEEGIDRLRSFYHDRGYLECRITGERKEQGRDVNLSVHVTVGPKVEFSYQGFRPSGEVKKQVRSAWQGEFLDVQRTEKAVRAIRHALVQKGYLQAKAEYDVGLPSADEKRISFSIDAGAHFHDVKLNFTGAEGIEPTQLKNVLRKEKLTTDVYVDPAKVERTLERFYRQHGYIDVAISRPRYELHSDTGTGKVIIAVVEGPEYRVRKVKFLGNKSLSDVQIRQAISFADGDLYRPELPQSWVNQVEELYWAHGYNDVTVDYELKRSPEAGGVDFDFLITENNQQVVDKIEIDGNHTTSDQLIKSQLPFAPGDILDYQKTNESRRRLYDTNAYTLVDIRPETIGKSASTLKGNQQAVALKVNVREVKPFELRYGGFYDTERGAGGIADFSNRNSLGSARLVGARLRYDSDVHEVRGYFSQPFLSRFPVDTNITGFFRREITQGQDTPDSGFITDRTGFTLQQEVQFRNKFILSYGYRFQRNHVYDMGPNPFFDLTTKTAPLTTTLTRDARDDLLDASRGSFLSQAFEYAPSFLGSDLRYIKYFGQYFHYLPLSRPTEVPWAGEVKSRLVFAGALRVGLAGGMGDQDLISSDKFFAGGGTTMRGFGQNEVGPKDFFGDPVGGNALLIINSELRFPLFSFLDGVGFMDIGNVYPSVRDFDPTDLRWSSGFGIRLRTPYFLLRADYGRKLDRKPGESSGKFFFSIGQAF